MLFFFFYTLDQIHIKTAVGDIVAHAYEPNVALPLETVKTFKSSSSQNSKKKKKCTKEVSEERFVQIGVKLYTKCLFTGTHGTDCYYRTAGWEA